jgi:predicted short-subunit dehydrogenase-like oxidoreductase (DUF2520 family)
VILGAGNVATHISRHLHFAGHRISCVWSRRAGPARQLAAELDSVGTADPDQIPREADFYLLAVPDAAIESVVPYLHDCRGICLHAAGAVPMDALAEKCREYGVLYPLQTFTAGRDLSLDDVPVLVEGSSPTVLEKIRSLALVLSHRVLAMDSAERLVLHLAAVFAGNFSNHMATIAERILAGSGHERTLLVPLLRETFRKIEESGGAASQTGPALRDDRETMERHLELLKGYPEWEKLYTFMSRDIRKTHG